MFHLPFSDEELFLEAQSYLKEELLCHTQKNPPTFPEQLSPFTLLPSILTDLFTPLFHQTLQRDAHPYCLDPSIEAYLIHEILWHFERTHRGRSVIEQKERFTKELRDPVLLTALPPAILTLFQKAFSLLPNCPLGALATVTVDRPLGSCHPKYHDMIYPVNYGYVEGIIAPDGEEQDAYILGVAQPIDRFEGEVIAIIERIDDCEDKWVVAPIGSSLTEEEISSITHFQERYFKTCIHLLSDYRKVEALLPL